MIEHRGYKLAILKWLKDLRDHDFDGGWVHEYKIRAMWTPQGLWIGARGDRDVRDLIETGELEKGVDGRYRTVRYAYPSAPKKTLEELEAECQQLLIRAIQ